MAEHHLDDSVTQPFWDNSVTPRLTIEPGDVVHFDCAEPTGQITPAWTADDLAHLDSSKVHALTGSVYVNGARPGDVLQVEILEMQHKGWGWSAHIPGFGLLHEDFPDGYLHHWRIDEAGSHSTEIDGLVVPFAPHPGCVGVAPLEPGRFDTLPPRANGGNVDIRDMTIGATIWLPVWVEGALFATGDCHAAQGQGEVCGTGIEAPMRVSMRFELRHDLKLQEIQLQRPARSGPAQGKVHLTTAHGPDLMENARNAVRYMIDWLVQATGMSASQAYILCSVAGDLVISEIVDAPNWIVAMQLPLALLPD